MLTAVESEYIRGLISVYQSKGYKYYMCHTVTENNNNYDACIYFSKQEIKAIDNNIFSINNGIKIYLDSSSRSYNYQTGYNDSPRTLISNNNFNGTVNVNVAEFVYTNAVSDYLESVYIINPDITKSGVSSYTNDNFSLILLILIVSILLFNFIRVIFRIK